MDLIINPVYWNTSRIRRTLNGTLVAKASIRAWTFIALQTYVFFYVKKERLSIPYNMLILILLLHRVYFE